MIVANIKSPQDLQSKKTLQTQLLDLEIANETESEKRMRDYKNPNRPIPVAPEYKTNAELQKDRLSQERQAIANMEELGFDYTKSAELIAWLSSSLINRLVEFNANFKGIKKELTETTNPKLLNSEYLKNYLEKYFEDIDINFGRKFGKEAVSSSATPSTATLDELDEILPEIRTIDEIRNNVRSLLRIIGEAKIRGTTEGAYLRGNTKLDEEIERLNRENQERELDSEGINALSEQRRREYREERKMYARQIIDLKKDQALISEIMPKLRTIAALLQLYSAVVPSHQMLNLLKQSLTQKERGDLVRRYIVVLRQSNFLSRSGADELASEISELFYRVENEGVIPFISDIIRWTNKSLKALSFVSNEAGISKITKLQRDYEVLLNQSGKIGEYERLKQYTDIMEKEIADGQAEMRRAMEEPAVELEDFLINPETQYTRPRNPRTGDDLRDLKDAERYIEDAERYGDFVREHTDKLRQLEDEERTYKEILKDPRYGLTAKDKDEIMEDLLIIQQALKNLKGAKEDFFQSSRDENLFRAEYKREKAEAEKQYSEKIKAKEDKERLNKFFEKYNPDAPRNIVPEIRPDVRPEERARYDEQKKTMIDIQRRFKAELKHFFADDPVSAIRSVRIFLRDDGGINEKKTQREKRTDEEWFRSLIFKVDDLGRKKIVDLQNQMGINFADYDPIEGMDKAKIYNQRGVNPVSETTYGLGFEGSAPKRLKRHKKAEKVSSSKDEMGKGGNGVSPLSSKDEMGKGGNGVSPLSSEDEMGKGGNGVSPLFRHKKIKVGRGITATETPSYLSFGKYVIHMGHLLDRNIANFKYPSLGSIPSIKPLTISEDYKDFILDTIDNQKPNERLFNKLTTDEQKHFERVISGAGLVDAFKLKRNRTEQEKKDSERFELLRGEVMAGNNSEKVLKELRGLIVRFINEGRIHQREGTTMLMEISSL
jgi:hypothetical protein